MFTQTNLRTIAATTLAGLIGTTGVVAAVSSGNGQVTMPSVATTTGPADQVPDPHSGATAASDAASAVATPTTPTHRAVGATPGTPAPVTPSPADHPTAAQPTAAARPTPEPADEIDEDGTEPPLGEPGAVDGVDLPDGPPPPPPVGEPVVLVEVPKPAPPLPPIPGPVDLVTPPMDPGPPPIDDFVAPVDPTPFDIATDFQVTPLPGYLGEISSGLTGCQLECVRSAVLTANDFDAGVHLAVETTVPVHVEVEVTRTGTDSSKFFNNPGYETSWETALQPLQPDTDYDLTLIAIDQDGHSKVYEHHFTTVDIVDGLAGNAHGCALACLTAGVVSTTDRHDVVEVHVASNAPAGLQVWFSTSEPTWVNDPDAKPASAPVFDDDTPSTGWDFEVSGLEADTVYHVVARAEDPHGVDYRVGSFRTDEQALVNVLVTFEQIVVDYDGDKGELNKGELAFSWGFDGTAIGWRNEQKMHAGTVTLADHHRQWFSIDPHTGAIPEITVGAHERDADGLVEFCTGGHGPGTEPSYHAACDTKTNVARTGGPLTPAQIEAFPLCGQFGVAAGPGARCAAVGSSVFGTRDPDYAHFAAVVSFVVD